MIKVKDKSPMYLNEDNMISLFSSEVVETHYRKAFYFYAATGCRLLEPFNGYISGNWLIIDSDTSKTGVDREVELNKNTLSILLEMRDRVEKAIGVSGHGSRSASRRWQIKKYSRKFKKCAIAEGFGFHKFHNLRDSDEILAASDAFFPFVDGFEKLVQAGITGVIQPAGSIRDKEIIKFANETRTKLVFAKTRLFKH